MWKDVFQKDITLRQRLHYLFGKPGWSHDGSRKTSEELRELEENRKSETINKQYSINNAQGFKMNIPARWSGGDY